MGKLVNLLKYKRVVNIKDKNGMAARDEDGNPVQVYMRVIGDNDIDEAQKKARLASAILRAKLLDPKSEEYTINISIFDDADRQVCIDLILQGQGAQLSGEAYAETVVPELPKIEEFAHNPDAPTLEELEKLDKAIEDTNQLYRQNLTNFIQERLDVFSKELEGKTDKELRKGAKESMIVITAIETYINTLRDEKVWRSVYEDELYMLPSFKNIDEYLNADINIKDQLREEYDRLEQGLDDLKN